MLWSSSPTANTQAPPPASSLSQRYCSVLVSWNSSTRMWRKRALVVLAQRLVALQQLVAAQQQLGEIDHALALALVLVFLVDLDAAAGKSSVRLDRMRAQAGFLGGIDEMHLVAAGTSRRRC
jgi:hypothetical protein